MAQDVVIAAAQRTAIGRLSGTLAGLSAVASGASLIRATLALYKIRADLVDEVVLGQALSAGAGANPARQTSVGAGLPVTTPATTVNHAEGSGLVAVIQAARAIALGDAELVIAGGQESMSQAPHLLPGSRGGRRLGDWTLVDSAIRDGLWDAVHDEYTERIAEHVATRYRIARQAQDERAARSQQRAENALKHGRFADEIRAVDVPQKAGEPIAFARDENPRPGVTTERLARFQPRCGHQGSVTPGNTADAGDGAAIVVLATAQRCEALGLAPLARLAGYASVGVARDRAGMGSVAATERCLSRAGWSIADLDLIEADETFAACAIAADRQLEWPLDRVNVNGGAIALGHPIGVSASRMLVSLLHEMVKRDARRGLVTQNASGGQGIALAISRCG